jgi:hypothetical protein
MLLAEVVATEDRLLEILCWEMDDGHSLTPAACRSETSIHQTVLVRFFQLEWEISCFFAEHLPRLSYQLFILRITGFLDFVHGSEL